MRKKYKIHIKGKPVQREYIVIPLRYIIALLIMIAEITAVIGIVIALCYYVPFFYLAALATQIYCVVRIIASDDNPDYKLPWLLFVLIIPIAGFMLYFMFYSRRLSSRYIKRMDAMKSCDYQCDDSAAIEKLQKANPGICSQAKMLKTIAGTSVFTDTEQQYLALGEDMHRQMLNDLEKAEKFIGSFVEVTSFQNIFVQSDFGNKIPLLTEYDFINDCDYHVIHYYELPQLKKYEDKTSLH